MIYKPKLLIIFTIIILLPGCSTAPVADVMDWLWPANAQAANLPVGGAGLPVAPPATTDTPPPPILPTDPILPETPVVPGTPVPQPQPPLPPAGF